MKLKLSSPGGQFTNYSIQLSLLQKIFNTLINSYIDNKVRITENFLSESLASHLKENLNTLYADQQLRSAGIGNEKIALHKKSVRNNMIYWLDRKHNDSYENDFF